MTIEMLYNAGLITAEQFGILKMHESKDLDYQSRVINGASVLSQHLHNLGLMMKEEGMIKGNGSCLYHSLLMLVSWNMKVSIWMRDRDVMTCRFRDELLDFMLRNRDTVVPHRNATLAQLAERVHDWDTYIKGLRERRDGDLCVALAAAMKYRWKLNVFYVLHGNIGSVYWDCHVGVGKDSHNLANIENVHFCPVGLHCAGRLAPSNEDTIGQYIRSSHTDAAPCVNTLFESDLFDKNDVFHNEQDVQDQPKKLDYQETINTPVRTKPHKHKQHEQRDQTPLNKDTRNKQRNQNQQNKQNFVREQNKSGKPLNKDTRNKQRNQTQQNKQNFAREQNKSGQHNSESQPKTNKQDEHNEQNRGHRQLNRDKSMRSLNFPTASPHTPAKSSATSTGISDSGSTPELTKTRSDSSASGSYSAGLEAVLNSNEHLAPISSDDSNDGFGSNFEEFRFSGFDLCSYNTTQTYEDTSGPTQRRACSDGVTSEDALVKPPSTKMPLVADPDVCVAESQSCNHGEGPLCSGCLDFLVNDTPPLPVGNVIMDSDLAAQAVVADVPTMTQPLVVSDMTHDQDSSILQPPVDSPATSSMLEGHVATKVECKRASQAAVTAAGTVKSKRNRNCWVENKTFEWSGQLDRTTLHEGNITARGQGRELQEINAACKAICGAM